jgi:hypothetical protein
LKATPNDARDVFRALGTPQHRQVFTPERWAVIVTPGLTIACTGRPSTWSRFWARVLLGWRWELLR